MKGLRLFRPAVERELTKREMETLAWLIGDFLDTLDSDARAGVRHSESVLRHRSPCEDILAKIEDVR